MNMNLHKFLQSNNYININLPSYLIINQTIKSTSIILFTKSIKFAKRPFPKNNRIIRYTSKTIQRIHRSLKRKFDCHACELEFHEDSFARSVSSPESTWFRLLYIRRRHPLSFKGALGVKVAMRREWGNERDELRRENERETDREIKKGSSGMSKSESKRGRWESKRSWSKVDSPYN